jgi:Putative beta-barrel porin 2
VIVEGILRRILRASTLFAACALVATPTGAQETKEPNVAKARLRLGPVALDPTIELTNLGVDTNVFNEPSGEEKQDFTFTLTPRARAWMKAGPTWLTADFREEIVWYQEYSSERATNAFFSGGWIVPLNRLAFGFDGTYLNARERPGYEIDERADRRELQGRAAVEYRAFARTFITAHVAHTDVEFDADEFFLSVNLSRELDRKVTNLAFGIKHELTPLTSISFDVGRQEDRFDLSPLRDSDSTTASVEVRFDPFALIKGAARIGYRDFAPLDASVPGYQGGTLAVDLSYVLQGSTRLTVQANRDVQYSFDVNQPYYLQTGISGSIAQQIYGPLDVVVRAGTHHLSYRDRAGASVAVPDRADDVRMLGAGFGYHVGSELRIGFNVDRSRRDTDVVAHRYEGYKVGVSVTYGL